MLISVVDGQGGGIGKQIIEKLSDVLGERSNVIIRALGTNALATNGMLKAGATDGATGENAIVVNAQKSDIIVGVVSIVIANSILGEVTPKMAEAIGSSDATKILIPISRCNTIMAMNDTSSMSQQIEKAVEIIQECTRMTIDR